MGLAAFRRADEARARLINAPALVILLNQTRCLTRGRPNRASQRDHRGDQSPHRARLYRSGLAFVTRNHTPFLIPDNFGFRRGHAGVFQTRSWEDCWVARRRVLRVHRMRRVSTAAQEDEESGRDIRVECWARLAVCRVLYIVF